MTDVACESSLSRLQGGAVGPPVRVRWTCPPPPLRLLRVGFLSTETTETTETMETMETRVVPQGSLPKNLPLRAPLRPLNPCPPDVECRFIEHVEIAPPTQCDAHPTGVP